MGFTALGFRAFGFGALGLGLWVLGSWLWGGSRARSCHSVMSLPWLTRTVQIIGSEYDLMARLTTRGFRALGGLFQSFGMRSGFTVFKRVLAMMV